MTDRKNLKCSPATKERFDRLKREGETTDGLLNRAFDALEADDDAVDYAEVERRCKRAVEEVASL